MVNFIDISKINCWIGQLSPGGSDKNNDEFKDECIKNGYYRLGWTLDDNKKYKNKDIKEIYYFKSKKEENIDFYFSKDLEKQEWKKNNKEKDDLIFEKDFKKKENGLDKALDSMSIMKEGDIIVTRVKGNYYIGRITKTAKYLQQKIGNDITYAWSVKVNGNKNTWIEIPATDMPGDIVGRFSQRRHPTIQRVGEREESIRFKLLLISIYKENASENQINNIKEIPKVILNKNNFVSSLNYMNLEDLVYLYIKNLKENEKFLLFPSTCKISKAEYEMDLINPERKIITCQVKNKQPVKYKEYESDANNNNYDKIYLFSGIEKYGDDEIKKKLENTKKPNDILIHNKIIIIRKENLFKYFKSNENEVKILKKVINLNKYYDDIKNETQKILTPKGWKECRRFSEEYKKEYKIDEFSSDVIFKNNVIRFSSEFNSLIQYKECDNEEFINELKEAYGIK